jgi:hypothetical protein
MHGMPCPFERSTSKITGPLSPGIFRRFSMCVVHTLVNKNTSEPKAQLKLSDDNSVFDTGTVGSVRARIAQAV